MNNNEEDNAPRNKNGSIRQKNRDGSYRKSGSGRRKGANSLVTMSLADLVAKLPVTANVVIGRKWAEQIGILEASETPEQKVVVVTEKEPENTISVNKVSLED